MKIARQLRAHFHVLGTKRFLYGIIKLIRELSSREFDKGLLKRRFASFYFFKLLFIFNCPGDRLSVIKSSKLKNH